MSSKRGFPLASGPSGTPTTALRALRLAYQIPIISNGHAYIPHSRPSPRTRQVIAERGREQTTLYDTNKPTDEKNPVLLLPRLSAPPFVVQRCTISRLRIPNPNRRRASCCKADISTRLDSEQSVGSPGRRTRWRRIRDLDSISGNKGRKKERIQLPPRSRGAPISIDAWNKAKRGHKA
ncbi:hypothetical protein C8R45DRAFT_1068703 [Mycena sanguinolenta]|nr:hypothetical protein C8R45DRAFT_1068703 [Mycena sanguinolenta]